MSERCWVCGDRGHMPIGCDALTSDPCPRCKLKWYEDAYPACLDDSRWPTLHGRPMLLVRDQFGNTVVEFEEFPEAAFILDWELPRDEFCERWHEFLHNMVKHVALCSRYSTP